jgi:hypothetical protein
MSVQGETLVEGIDFLWFGYHGDAGPSGPITAVAALMLDPEIPGPRQTAFIMYGEGIDAIGRDGTGTIIDAPGKFLIPLADVQANKWTRMPRWVCEACDRPFVDYMLAKAPAP